MNYEILPKEQLEEKARQNGIATVDSVEFCNLMDTIDPLKQFREEFYFPSRDVCNGKTNGVFNNGLNDTEGNGTIYLCGHSLGLQPKQTRKYVDMVLNDWMNRGVESHFSGFLPSASCETYCKTMMSEIVGCDPKDIAIMNGLTVNLHLMLSYFYMPTMKRNKVLMEQNAFCSDRYAVTSHLLKHGYDPSTSLIQLRPREGEFTLRTEDIINIIETEGSLIDLILLPGVQFYSGQSFQIEKIVPAAHKMGCKVGLDMAHSVGNVKMELGKWQPDFAVWCTYKYLNAGAGSLGGIYVNNKYTSQANGATFLKGWWGNKVVTRFQMKEDFEPEEGADRFKISNQSPVLSAMLLASLEVFHKAKMENLLAKQRLLTGYLEYLLNLRIPSLKIITPSNPNERGNQLSILVSQDAKTLVNLLNSQGVHCDARPPYVIRVAPAPLYNSFSDVKRFVDVLSTIHVEQ